MSRRPPPATQSGVIPQSWTPVTRPTDGEHVGYAADGADGLVVPTSLVGLPSSALSAVEPEPTVRLEFAEPAELRGRAVLPVPVGDLRRRGP
jgi:hypothetical protein